MLPLVASMRILSRREQPAPLAVEDHVQRRPVLHAAAGVVPLGLGVDLDRRDLGRHPLEREQRRVADQVEKRTGRLEVFEEEGRSREIPTNPSGEYEIGSSRGIRASTDQRRPGHALRTDPSGVKRLGPLRILRPLNDRPAVGEQRQSPVCRLVASEPEQVRRQLDGPARLQPTRHRSAGRATRSLAAGRIWMALRPQRLTDRPLSGAVQELELAAGRRCGNPAAGHRPRSVEWNRPFQTSSDEQRIGVPASPRRAVGWRPPPGAKRRPPPPGRGRRPCRRSATRPAPAARGRRSAGTASAPAGSASPGPRSRRTRRRPRGCRA